MGSGGSSTMQGAGWEVDFEFGGEDNTDYWHFKDDGVDIVD